MTPVETVPHLEWEEVRRRMRWAQGEHVALVGPTGAGKTTAALSLVQPDIRDGYVMLTSTKPHDSTLRKLGKQGWRTIKSWPPPADVRRIAFHAPLVDLEDGPVVGAALNKALRGAYRATSWCIVLDDLQNLIDVCGLGRIVRTLLLNGRSARISVVASTQRPRWVAREVWTQSTHLFIWRCVDADDLRALAGLGNADTKLVRSAVQSLNFEAHECLYVNTRTGFLAVTVIPES